MRAAQEHHARARAAGILHTLQVHGVAARVVVPERTLRHFAAVIARGRVKRSIYRRLHDDAVARLRKGLYRRLQPGNHTGQHDLFRGGQLEPMAALHEIQHGCQRPVRLFGITIDRMGRTLAQSVHHLVGATEIHIRHPHGIAHTRVTRHGHIPFLTCRPPPVDGTVKKSPVIHPWYPPLYPDGARYSAAPSNRFSFPPRPPRQKVWPDSSSRRARPAACG